MGGFFDAPKKRAELERTEALISDPEFWNDQEKAQKVVQRRSWLERALKQQENFETGVSDAEVLHDAAQIRSSLLLTRWLMSRFHIALKNVIGHNESLSSPFHKELYAPWRRQTHGDWTHADMTVYRLRLAATR